jgi:acyl-CoA synthetase (AMP-forming)/AMP-acid ligase II
MTRYKRLVDVAAAIAKSDPSREAIAASDVRLTYGELLELSQSCAMQLMSAGLEPGSRVAFLGRPAANFAVCEFATHLAGGVWLGLNPKYTERELTYVISDAKPSIIFFDASLPSEVSETCRLAASNVGWQLPLIEISSPKDFQAKLPKLSNVAYDIHDDTALIVYTSGTTGAPKGACITHRGMVLAGQIYESRYGHPGTRTLMNLPINHVGGLIDVMASTISSGGAMVTMEDFDPVTLPDVMREERVSSLGQVPAMHLAIDSVKEFDPDSFPDLRHLIWSGSAMPRSWIEAKYGCKAELSSCYGLTESTGSVTFTRPGATISEMADTVGVPFENGLVRIGTSDGDQVELGDDGEVQIRSPMVMAGYLGRSSDDPEAFTPDGWLRTGDQGRMREDGAIVLVGRLKEMFKSGGYNVYPREIEQVLESFPGVAAAAVLPVSDDKWSEVGWAFVLSEEDVNKGALNDHAKRLLANYKVPKRYIVESSLPLLPIGKIDKAELKKRIATEASRA